jgi:uncharacterized protein (DUF488 family)
MEISTIGFTKLAARSFFGRLKSAGIEQLVDVRLNNVSQLAGFAKKDDLEFFLQEIVGASYVHEPLLAPEPATLIAYRNKDMPWADYEQAYLDLLATRNVESTLSKDFFAPRTVLLCSEHTPDQCHRRLAVEYLNQIWGGITITHL